jgi:hypothetical protein
MRLVRDDLRPGYDHLRRCGVGAVDAALLVKLGHDLRSMYTDMLAQPVPGDLASLVDRFAESEAPARQGKTWNPN